jgi:hypothetical protein
MIGVIATVVCSATTQDQNGASQKPMRKGPSHRIATALCSTEASSALGLLQSGSSRQVAFQDLKNAAFLAMKLRHFSGTSGA